MNRLIRSVMVGITVGLFISAPVYAANSQVPNCDTLTASSNPAVNQTAIGLCHQIKSDAVAKGMTYQQYAAYLKQNPGAQQSYANYAKSTVKVQSQAVGLAAMADVSSPNSPGCQALCGAAQVMEAIPIIGWIIATGLISAAIAEGCGCGSI